ncbi:MAG: restriction endonuclease, partial [Verrucomicrobia bacterium]|nr:restriction endonuclease [Verrucomicrobiota bacterium]
PAIMNISSKKFEFLTANLQRQFAGGSNVQQNAKILGRHSGKKREVDVAIRTSVAGESLLIAVECRRRGRKSDIAEVEAFASKLDDIAAHKGIMVSAKGFSKTVKRIATAKGISLYRYEDTLSDGWPSGLETSVIVEVWELLPMGAYIRRVDGSTTNIQTDDEHEYFYASGNEVLLSTVLRIFWEIVPEKDKCNGDQSYEHRIGRLQFEGLVDDESKVAKVMGWKMVFPEEISAAELEDNGPSGSALSLLIRSTLVRTNDSHTAVQLKLLLYGHLEITVGQHEVYDLPFT